jgi:hypothetical protein
VHDETSRTRPHDSDGIRTVRRHAPLAEARQNGHFANTRMCGRVGIGMEEGLVTVRRGGNRY